MRPPSGIKNLAVEAIYDTSRHVLPHDILWAEIQAALIASGRFRLTSQKEASAVLRIHLSDANINPSGSIEGETFKKDPDITNSNLPPIKEFSNLTRASRWTVRESISLKVETELIDLFTGKKLHTANYDQAGDYLTARTRAQAQTKSQFLLYEEGQQSSFRNMARAIANQVVNSILRL